MDVEDGSFCPERRAAVLGGVGYLDPIDQVLDPTVQLKPLGNAI